MLTPPQLPALPPTQETLDAIVAALPAPRVVPASIRPLLVFVARGGPGIGTSALAKAVANATNCELISPDAIIAATIFSSLPGGGENQKENTVDEEGDPSEEKQHTTVNVNSFEKGVFDRLLAGQEIDSAKFLDGYKALAASNDAQHKGIVIDGLPFTSPWTNNLIEEVASQSLIDQVIPDSLGDTEVVLDDNVESSPPPPPPPPPRTYKYKDLETLASILDSKPHNFRLVLVDMVMAEQDLKQRRTRQWVDPITGILYPGGQVEYSRRRRKEGWVDGTLDAENEAALVLEDKTWDFEVHDDLKKGKKKNLDGGDEDDEGEGGGEDDGFDGEGGDEDNGDDGEGEEDENGEPRKKKQKAPVSTARFNLSNKNTWSILPKEILDRLLKRPEDTPEIMSQEFEKYKEKSLEIEKLTAKYFDSLHTIKLDASQHPDILLKSAINRLGSLGFNLLEKPPMSKKLEVSPGTFTGMTQNDIYTYLNALELESGEPPREESSWGRFCPVQYYETGKLVHNGFETPISYRGFFFFLSDQESLRKFLANPDKYLEVAPSLRGAKLCILGGPFTAHDIILQGKTAQSKMIAKIYNLKFISVDEILEAWDSDPNQEDLKNRVPMYAEIVRRCKKGQSVAPETMIELIKMALNDEVLVPSLSKPSTPTTAAVPTEKKSGWIIDGFPRTLDEARAMVVGGLIPEYVVLLKNDINEERVRMRLKIHLSDSKTGKVWDEKSNSFRSTPLSNNLQQQYTSNTKLGSTAKLGSPHTRIASETRLGSPAATNTPGRLSSPGKAGSSTAHSQSPLKSIKSTATSLPKPTPPRGPVKSKHGTRAFSRASHRHSTNRDGAGTADKKPQHIDYDMPSLPITTFPYFDNLFNGFREELPDIIKLLENKTKIVETGAEQAIPTILAIIQTAIDPFLPKAYEISEKTLHDNPTPFEQGSTKDFCPFALRQVNILQKGNPQIAVRYMGQMYNLTSEDAKYAFLMEPHNFVSVRNLMTPPPPRFFFLGPTGSGKSVCMKELAKWGAPVIKFSDYVYEFAATAEKAVKEEIEYMMKENAGLLSPVLVEDVVTSLFKKEPYASKGFLLEGFPRTKAEAEVVVKHNMHIDGVVLLRIDPEVAAHRIMTEKKKDLKAKRNEAKSLLRVNSGNTKAAAQLAAAEAEIKKMDGQEMEMYDFYLDSVDKENLRIGDVTGTFESAWQVPIIEIDCNKCIRPVLGSLRRNCKQFCEYRSSILSNAYKVEYREAELLMRLGIKTYSPFGNICPVSLKKNSSVLKRLTGTKPVVYRTHIYYLRNEENQEEFISNLHEYISQPPPQPVVRPQVCILGRPKSGKSVAAARIAREYDMVHLTVPIIVNSIIEGKENLELSKQLANILNSGLELPDELVNQAVMLVTSRAVCLARGWVLDGYPQTIGQAKELEKMGLVPHMVFELNISEQEMYLRSANDVKIDVK
ncbi:UNVERIFIED_CONTAM: adenylate kinase [Siphonaria sp. JEL0065]|nr:adenylate kinase [Siphonaria sp. JEL0065]